MGIFQEARCYKYRMDGLAYIWGSVCPPLIDSPGNIEGVEAFQGKQAVEDAEHLVGVVGPVAFFETSAVGILDDLLVVAKPLGVVVGDGGFAHKLGAQTQGVPYGMAEYYSADLIFRIGDHGSAFRDGKREWSLW